MQWPAWERRFCLIWFNIIFFSAERDQRRRNGTAFSVLITVRPTTKRFVPTSNRKSRLRNKRYLHNRTTINVFAQTESANNERKEHFYTKLSHFWHCSKIISCNRDDTFYHKIWKESFRDEVGGKYTVNDVTSGIGQKLIPFAQMHDTFEVITKYDSWKTSK